VLTVTERHQLAELLRRLQTAADADSGTSSPARTELADL